MSKNAIALTFIFVAVIFGSLLGTSLAATGAMSLDTSLLLLILSIGGAAIFCFWALSSNKSGAKADPAMLADARAMQVPEGKARIYVVRRGFVAALQGMNITIDGTAKGQIKSGQMLMIDVAPGQHHIHVATAKQSLARPAELEIDVGASGIVVIDAMVEMGALKGAVKLKQLDAAKARENVHATKLVLWEVSPA